MVRRRGRRVAGAVADRRAAVDHVGHGLGGRCGPRLRLGPRGIRGRAVEPPCPVGPQGGAAPAGRSDRKACRGPGGAGRARQWHRDLDGAEGRTRFRRADLPLLRRGAGQGLRRDCPNRRQRAGAGSPRAGGSRRRHRAVEFPADDRRLEDRTRAGDGQFGGAETGGNRLADFAETGRTGAGGRPSPRRLQRRHRPRMRDGRGAGPVARG